MASRLCSLSRPTITLVRSAISRPTLKPKFSSLHSFPSFSSPSIPRSFAQLGALQSLLPLHSAISSARLTSCLGVDPTNSRSMSQGDSKPTEDSKSMSGFY